jgi:threonine dehydratase
VIGVEPEASPSMSSAIAAGGPVDVTYGGYAADSLGTRRAGEIAFEIVSEHIQSVVLVSDDAIRDAQLRLWQEVRIFAEPGGATSLAALLSGAYGAQPGEHVAVVVCGANGDLEAVAPTSDLRAT